MSDLFSKLNQLAKENQKRWEKIDCLCDELSRWLKSDNRTGWAETNMANLLLLLVEQMRPNQVSEDQIDELQKEMSNLSNIFKGGPPKK